ncbi:MAG: hypothetical protein JSV65_09355 [Armatimonadota bacterium]|nr:MAG: hypothetical protein JSV65_09355 [Armatimonadota bacterium]
MSAGDTGRELEPTRQVTFAKPRPGELPFYLVADTALPYGPSLGNHKLWVTCKSSGAIEKVFSLDLGADVMGSMVVTYAVPGDRPLQSLLRSGEEPAAGDPRFTLLRQEGPAAVEIHPMRQRRTIRLSGGLHVVETILLPKSGGTDPAVVFVSIDIRNESDETRMLRVSAYGDLQGSTPPDVMAEYEPDLEAFVARNREHPDWVRVFGCTTPVSSYETTHDVSQVYADGWARGLRNDTSATGAILGALQANLSLESQESRSLSFVLAFAPEGAQAARGLYLAHRDPERALADTIRYLTPTLSVAMVETPDPIINQGVFWAKVNMLRVMGAYPQGIAFTNEPGVSSNVVGRDVVWYTYGCDYLLPDISRELLRALARHQYPDGKIVEYYSALTGERADYDLNVNDDTPLFVLGVCHHYLATGDKGFLRELYPAAERAGRYLLSQRDERGLVYSSAEGVEVWGIASWRNVIPNYQINGAVTEINAECYAALRSLSAMAKGLSDDEAAEEFAREAAALRAAINQHLLNPNTRMYYLNIDTRGAVHTDVTADEIFPVMFGVSDNETSFQIISRLNAPDFTTAAGLRTVSRESPEYEPMKNVGLMGGVWPGVTFWYASAAAPYHPEFMAEALHSSYSHYLRNPLANNTVPGQFSEWFDGESLVNRGMRLSPWEPPRLLWAAVEGACGIIGTGDGCRCQPLIPPQWQWIGLRRLPHCGRSVSFYAARQNDGLHIYANAKLDTDHTLHDYEEDVTNRVHVLDYRAHRLALRKDGELLICVGSSAETTIPVPITIAELLADDHEYAVEMYNSELGQWQQGDPRKGRGLRQLAFPIEAGGFRILRITKR